MSGIYPEGPTCIPTNLSKPRQAYRQRAMFATVGVLLFVGLYLALSGWFVWTAYRLLSTGKDIFFGILSGFIAVFLLKALFRVKHNPQLDSLEVSLQDEPKLFAFLYRLADEAQAPRPHRVFLSPRVNAGVFYDVSALNLFFPSKKNLDIGLGLVNVLTLGEIKAVLAHEFGHFAQRSMAVGRWVYLAQQIAAHIIAERDALDNFLRVLSRLDLRVAWIGWLLSLAIWSIRSLLETTFGWLVIAQRALAREMEFQADLVAVSLTGSDALVHALHRLHAADDAWDRTLRFANSELRNGRRIIDLFALQARLIEQIRMVLNDEKYGQVPPLPAQQPERHRLFQAELTEPPRMWATHPPNLDREHNAKRIYIRAPLDNRSAWSLFKAPKTLRKQVSAQIFATATQNTDTKLAAPPLEDSIHKLDLQFDRHYLDPAYRGAYLGRSLTRAVKQPEDLYKAAVDPEKLGQYLAALYPESLSQDLEQLRVLEKEITALEALRDRRLEAPGGIIKHRGKPLKHRDLPTTILNVNKEKIAVQVRVNAHDRLCRTTHHAIAAQLDKGWDVYLIGLSKVLHYAAHTEANLQDIRGYVANVFNVVTADRHVSRRELKRLLTAASELYQILAEIYAQSPELQLDERLLASFEGEAWPAVLGNLELPPPGEGNIGSWLQAIDGWVEHTVSALSTVRLAALECLLASERLVADAYHHSETPVAAPPPSEVPKTYAILLMGSERKLQTRLGWWDRFQTADGFMPSLLRLSVASGIIAFILWGTATAGR